MSKGAATQPLDAEADEPEEDLSDSDSSSDSDSDSDGDGGSDGGGGGSGSDSSNSDDSSSSSGSSGTDGVDSSVTTRAARKQAAAEESEGGDGGMSDAPKADTITYADAVGGDTDNDDGGGDGDGDDDGDDEDEDLSDDEDDDDDDEGGGEDDDEGEYDDDGDDLLMNGDSDSAKAKPKAKAKAKAKAKPRSRAKPKRKGNAYDARRAIANPVSEPMKEKLVPDSYYLIRVGDGPHEKIIRAAACTRAGAHYGEDDNLSSILHEADADMVMCVLPGDVTDYIGLGVSKGRFMAQSDIKDWRRCFAMGIKTSGSMIVPTYYAVCFALSARRAGDVDKDAVERMQQAFNDPTRYEKCTLERMAKEGAPPVPRSKAKAKSKSKSKSKGHGHGHGHGHGKGSSSSASASASASASSSGRGKRSQQASQDDSDDQDRPLKRARVVESIIDSIVRDLDAEITVLQRVRETLRLI